jgi:hypothetical protein
LFTKKQDIEIAAFFAAIFSWGNRTTIINKSKELMQLMDYAPYDFCTQHTNSDLKKLINFKHRTFNATDLLYFVHFFQYHYVQNKSLETAFTGNLSEADMNMENMLNQFYYYFFSLPDAPDRTRKHIASPHKNSSCKRLCMFLRWMVRSDNKGVDFGLWKRIKPSQLIIPLDVHVLRVAQNLGLINRLHSDWTGAKEITNELKKMDPHDPVKYDFALFSLGIIEKF